MRYVKYLVILMIGLSVLFTAGCGKRDRNTEGSLENPAISWQASYTPLEIPYDFAFATDHIYGCYAKDDLMMLDRINKQDNSVKETLAIPNAVLIMGMTSDQEGNIYLMGSITAGPEESTGESLGLWRIDTEGDLADHTEIELEDTEETLDLLLKGIYTDQNENFFIWCEMLVKEEESGAWHREDRVYVNDIVNIPLHFSFTKSLSCLFQ